jgi:hypothetical protein
VQIHTALIPINRFVNATVAIEHDSIEIRLKPPSWSQQSSYDFIHINCSKEEDPKIILKNLLEARNHYLFVSRRISSFQDLINVLIIAFDEIP